MILESILIFQQFMIKAFPFVDVRVLKAESAQRRINNGVSKEKLHFYNQNKWVLSFSPVFSKIDLLRKLGELLS